MSRSSPLMLPRHIITSGPGSPGRRFSMITQHPAAPAPPTELLFRDERDLSALHTLADLSHLTTLWLWSPHLSDLGPLAGLTHLTALDLAYCPQMRDLSPL